MNKNASGLPVRKLVRSMVHALNLTLTWAHGFDDSTGKLANL
jgi:hypothetical protein